MKKTLSVVIVLFFVIASNAQTVFWTEDFGVAGGPNCPTQNQLASSFTGANGTWAITNTGGNGAAPNNWFVSSTEAGMGAGNCGDGCLNIPALTNQTLHIGSDPNADCGCLLCPTGDCGAAYDACNGSTFCGLSPLSDKRAESPVINCTGYSTITMGFAYIENGQGTADDATVWYFDGTTWAQIDNPPKSTVNGCGGGQHRWVARTVALPASANNNANVKIGFRWVNNVDGAGADPSFAVDDITLSVAGGAAPVASFSVTPSTTICVNACVNFTDQSTNAPTSWSWTFTGGSPATSAAQNPSTICYSTAGTYTATLTATNANGSSSTSQTITVNPLPTANAGADVTICQSTSTTLGAGGGGTYSWSPATGLSNPNISNPVASPIITTTYSVTVTNSCGSNTDAVVVTVNPLPTANAGADVTICPGDNATLTATGGGSYLWNTGATTASISVSPTITTSYSVTVTNSCGSNTDDVNVVVSNNITASISGNTTICSGQSTTLTAFGGTNYSWNTSAITAAISVSPTSTASYTVYVSSGSCADTTSVTVNVNASPTASVSANPTICAGQTATLTAGGGTNYSWSNTATTASISISPTATTTYSVIVTNASGCSDTTSATVTVNATPTASVSGNTSICIGDVATLTASGGTDYLWSTGATTAVITDTPSSSTPYTVTVTNASGCSDTTTVTVTVFPPPTATISANNTTICSGENVTLTAMGGGNYSWNTNATTAAITVSPTINTSYTVIVSIGTCADDTASATVTVLATPNPSIAGNTTICSGQTATLSALGGNFYSWNTGDTTAVINIAPTITTSYTVTATNANGCSSSATVTVTVSSSFASVSGNTNICQGQTTTLTASGGGTYFWNTGETTVSITASTAGIYSVIVSSGTCSDTASATVTVNPNPTAGAASDTTITQGQSAMLTASGGGTYSWSNGANGATLSVSPTITTVYCVTVTNTNNCTDISCVTVTVEPLDCSGAGELYLPNAFSPNGDLENDTLQIYYGNFLCIKFLLIEVYNRWGEKVFESDKPAFRWDGTSKAKKLDSGVYAYHLQAHLNDDSIIDKKGNVTLFR